MKPAIRSDAESAAATTTVAAESTKPVYTYDQILDQLVYGSWNGDRHRFNVTQGGTITVNVTGLTSEGKALALAALGQWPDIIGIDFVQVTSGGQIVFDDEEAGAYSSSSWSNHIISSSFVNVGKAWLADYGTELGSYSFQTYIHEIGHALGLGHTGNYDVSATFATDALYANDAWATSVMSYFAPFESDYFSARGFTYNFLVTPMNGDIVAITAPTDGTGNERHLLRRRHPLGARRRRQHHRRWRQRGRRRHGPTLRRRRCRQFVFRSGDFGGINSLADRIHDFSHAEGDRISLELVDADTTQSGDQAFTFRGTGAFTGDAGELRFEQISGNTYVQGDLDGDGVADFWIRLDGLHTLTSSDFLL